MFALAIRNLSRNRRRSVLTASAIAFSVALMMFSASTKGGQYDLMIANATKLLTGDAQIQAPGYREDPNPRLIVNHAAALKRALAGVSGVVNVRARAEAFVLVSVDEHGFGAQVMGVEPAAERAYSSLPGLVSRGRYLATDTAAEAVIGSALARNLGAHLGSELVILGTGREGSVAALAVTVVGIIDSGVIELDRALVQVPINVFLPAFEFADAASTLVVQTRTRADALALAPAMRAVVHTHSPGAVVLPWPQLIADVLQSIEFSAKAQNLFYGLLGVMVVFSIANTFVMTVFERTREFGMLLALGMRPGQLQWLVQLEALLLCVGGVLAGFVIGLLVVLLLMHFGIPLPESTAALMQRFHLPSRIYPVLSAGSMLVPAIAMLVGTQLAAVLPTLRLRRLQPVAAMRGE